MVYPAITRKLRHVMTTEPSLVHPYMREVLLASHGDTSHHRFSKNLKELKLVYANDVRDYGIAPEYVRALITTYGCQMVSKVDPIEGLCKESWWILCSGRDDMCVCVCERERERD